MIFLRRNLTDKVIDTQPSNNPWESQESYSPWIGMLYLIAFVIVGMFVFNFFGLVFASPLISFDVEEIINKMSNPTAHENMRIPLLIIQGVTSFGAFILMPYLFGKYRDQKAAESLSYDNSEDYLSYGIVLLFTLMIMPFSAKMIEWNESWVFPEFLKSFENWAVSTNESLELTTEYILNLQGPLELFLAVIVIGVIPAIGEEYLFRGYLQRYFIQAFNNVHIGIWLTSFLFGFFHFQIFGLVPRMLLGVYFGYFYHFSKNLYLPILAHFFNNTFMVVMSYLYLHEMIEFDVAGEEQITWMMVLPSLAISIVLFFYLKFRYPNSKEDEGLASGI